MNIFDSFIGVVVIILVLSESDKVWIAPEDCFIRERRATMDGLLLQHNKRSEQEKQKENEYHSYVKKLNLDDKDKLDEKRKREIIYAFTLC